MSSVFGSKKLKYYTPDFTASRDDRIQRLKFELRQHIRCLASYTMFSAEWIRMAESLEQIAKVAFMETNLPIQVPNVDSQQGRKGDGTLWDQEKDEIAVRILLEEGKLNLCLRLLAEFKELEQKEGEIAKLIQAASTSEQTTTKLQALASTFETSLGLMLKLALFHVEALQIMDLPLLIAHSALVMTAGAKSIPSSIDLSSLDDKGREELLKHQLTLVPVYLSSLACHLESMEEERIMDLFEQHNLLLILARMIIDNTSWFNEEIQLAFGAFFANVFSSETYLSEKKRFVGTRELKELFCRMPETFLDKLVDHETEKAKRKKLLRPLYDQIKRWKVQI